MDDTSTRSVMADRHPWSVFLVFLRLGLTSFGGPIAHLGYFRDEFVVRRRWLSERSYADVVALCQFLPGPSSSQVGIALGLTRAGYGGAFAAWLGFTLPSAIALILFASLLLHQGDLSAGMLQGLKIAAVAVVAQAVWGMGRNLCPDRLRVTHVLSQPHESWTGRKGRIDEAMIREIIKESPRFERTEYYMCGPSGLMETAEKTFSSQIGRAHV